METSVPLAHQQEPEKKAATKRKSDKGKDREEVADEAVRTDQPIGTTAVELASQDKARPGEPALDSTPVPTEIPVPQAELKPPESERAKPENSETAVVKSEAKQLCPDCQSPMIIKTAGRGKNKGKKFLGCLTFPKCTGTRSLDGQATLITTVKAS